MKVKWTRACVVADTGFMVTNATTAVVVASCLTASGTTGAGVGFAGAGATSITNDKLPFELPLSVGQSTLPREE